jgi:K+-transporting ATPase A subunit
MLREVCMEPKPGFLLEQLERPFWQLYLIILIIDTALVFFGSLILGDIRQMSNLFFWSTLIMLIVAAIPIFFEIGSRAKIIGKSLKEGEEVSSQMEDKKKSFDRGARITYLFGLSGITTFILAFLALGLF